MAVVLAALPLTFVLIAMVVLRWSAMVAGAAGLALAGRMAAPETLTLVFRALTGRQVVQPHCFRPPRQRRGAKYD